MDSIWGNLFRRGSQWERQVATLWGRTPLFEGIPQREIRRLVSSMMPRTYAAGEHVFHHGDQGAGAALIVEGAVEIRSGGVRLAQLGAGDFFGEIALVLDVPRTADAVATQETRLIFFLHAGLEEWLGRKPYYAARLSKNLALVLAHRLLAANRSLAHQGATP